MGQEFLNKLKENGVDVEKTVARFCGNADLFEKFILKFPSDGDFALIKPAFDKKDYLEALNTTHTLKGVSGNLGLTRLYTACSNTVALIRAQKYQEASDSYPEIEASYNQIVSVIKEYGGSND
jgi:histidine phosphotransfer protein HptB